MILGLKNLTNRLIGRGGTGKSFLPPNVLLARSKHATSFIVTDPKCEMFGPVPAEYSSIPEKHRKAYLASNNWRKMHGYPLRRGAANKYYKDTRTERQMLLLMERVGFKFL